MYDKCPKCAAEQCDRGLSGNIEWIDYECGLRLSRIIYTETWTEADDYAAECYKTQLERANNKLDKVNKVCESWEDVLKESEERDKKLPKDSIDAIVGRGLRKTVEICLNELRNTLDY